MLRMPSAIGKRDVGSDAPAKVRFKRDCICGLFSPQKIKEKTYAFVFFHMFLIILFIWLSMSMIFYGIGVSVSSSLLAGFVTAAGLLLLGYAVGMRDYKDSAEKAAAG